MMITPMFDPKVGDRVTAEVAIPGRGRVGVTGRVMNIDSSEVLSHEVWLDESMDVIGGARFAWFRPQDLGEEYQD